MTRTLALLALVALLAGCTRFHNRGQGPFAKPVLEPPVPYGTTTPAPEADADGFPPFRKRLRPKADTPPAPLPPQADIPKADAPAAKNLADLKALASVASAAWKAVDTLEATVTRREINPLGAATSEVVLFQFRREPMALFTRTLSETGKGREILYNPTQHSDKIHLMLGKGDERFPLRVGSVVTVSPDDARVKEKARYGIRESGLSRNAARLADAVAKVEAGKLPADALTYNGEMTREEYPHPLVGVTLALRPGDDPLFPNGGTRTYFFDMKEKSPSYGLSVLSFATDAKGKEAEYYLFEKVKSPAGLTDANFDPKRLGKK